MEFTDEWSEHKFENIFDIKNGLNKGKDYFGEGIRILNYMDVNKYELNTENTIKGLVELTDDEIERYSVKPNDLFFTRTSETSEEIGLISAYMGNTIKCVFSGFLLRARPKIDLNSLFFAYYLRSPRQRNNIIKFSSITTRALISGGNLSKMKIKYPSIEEQNKIANLFLILDKKVELLEKKYREYQCFKKYLMQKLFAQELRFVDFNNSSWKDYKFKDLGTVKSGVGFSNKYQGHLDLDYNFYKVSDMNLKGNEKVMTRSNNTIDDNLLKDIGVKLIENPSIIFAKVGEAIFLNRKRIAKQPFLIDNNMMAFSPNENVDLEFMYYLATSINFGKYAQTGALPSYNASDIYSIKCKIPPIEEQKRIGKLLSLADNKIDFCSNQLNKTQEFKKGLLQQMFVVRINWRCNFKLAKSPSFNKHLLILKNTIIFIIIK